MANQYTKYWDVVDITEWVWLFIICIYLMVNGKVPAFSVSMAILMTLLFKVIDEILGGENVRDSKVGVVLAEGAILFLTCVISAFAKEFFKGFYNVVVNVSNSEIESIQRGHDAIPNGESIIASMLHYVGQVGSGLKEAFVTAPFITGESVIAFAVLSYIVTRVVSFFLYTRRNNSAVAS